VVSVASSGVELFAIVSLGCVANDIELVGSFDKCCGLSVGVNADAAVGIGTSSMNTSGGCGATSRTSRNSGKIGEFSGTDNERITLNN
jgi:hypothetical protein